MELEDKLLSTQDELLEITDVAAKYEWECEEMRKEHERECLKSKNEIYRKMQTAHEKELDAQDELICLQKEKLKRDKTDVDGDNVQRY